VRLIMRAYSFGYTKNSYNIQIYFIIVILSYSNYIQWGFYWKPLVSTLTLLFLLSRKRLEVFCAQSLPFVRKKRSFYSMAARLRLSERRKRRKKGGGREIKYTPRTNLPKSSQQVERNNTTVVLSIKKAIPKIPPESHHTTNPIQNNTKICRGPVTRNSMCYISSISHPPNGEGT